MIDPPSRSLRAKRPTSTTLHTERLETSLPATAAALTGLSHDFSPLFDRAACAIRAEGYDLDDVVLERWLVCRVGAGDEVRLRAEPLSDSARLADAVHQALGVAPPRAEATVTALEVLVLLEQGA